MKKVITMLLVVVLMAAYIPANAELKLVKDMTQEELDISYLMENTIDWAQNNGYQQWAEGGVDENGVFYGCGMATKDDTVFYDATPDTIMRDVYKERINENVLHNLAKCDSIECECLGHPAGYGIYRVQIKWHAIDKALESQEGYFSGMDVLVRFYN